MTRQGPLTHLKIVEFAGIGPAPYGAMLLADLGAQIIRIDRPGGYPALAEGLDLSAMDAASVCNRSRDLIRLDLKSEEGRATVLRLMSEADAVIEAYRPARWEKHLRPKHKAVPNKAHAIAVAKQGAHTAKEL